MWNGQVWFYSEKEGLYWGNAAVMKDTFQIIIIEPHQGQPDGHGRYFHQVSPCTQMSFNLRPSQKYLDVSLVSGLYHET